MKDEALPLSQAAGLGLRHLRQEYGATADDVASSAGLVGFRWVRSTVSSIETGRRELTAEELLALPLIVSGFADRDVSLWDLLALAGGVVRMGGASVTLTGLRAIATEGRTPAADELRLPRSLEESMRIGLDWASRTLERLRQEIPAAVETNVLRLLEFEELGRGEAEQKAARKLDRSAAQVAAAAVTIWGEGLTRHRDQVVAARLPEGTPASTVRAVRGRVTRELLAELAPVVTAWPSVDEERQAGRGER